MRVGRNQSMESRFKDTLRTFFGNLFVKEVVLVPVWIRTWRIKFAFIECINQPFISHFIIMICSTYSLNHPFISHSQAIMILTYKNILWREWEKSFLSKKVSRITGFYSNIPHTFACSVTVLQSVARYSMFLHDREL